MVPNRIQVRFTPEQRAKLEAAAAEEGTSMTELVRTAVDAYLDTGPTDIDAALAATFGAIPDLAVPTRDEWNR
jgi:hypothetical protein